MKEKKTKLQSKNNNLSTTFRVPPIQGLPEVIKVSSFPCGGQMDDILISTQHSSRNYQLLFLFFKTEGAFYSLPVCCRLYLYSVHVCRLTYVLCKSKVCTQSVCDHCSVAYIFTCCTSTAVHVHAVAFARQ